MAGNPTSQFELIYQRTYQIILNFLDALEKYISVLNGPVIARLHQFMQYYNARGYLIVGKEKKSNLDLKVLYYGNKVGLKYLISILFLSELEIKKKNNKSTIKLLNETNKIDDDVDLLIINTDRFFYRRLEKKGFIIVPEWIDAVLDTTNPFEEIFATCSKITKKNIKNIKKYGYTYEIHSDKKMLDFFYSRMFYPYISRRHDELVPPLHYKYIKSLLYNCKVLLIKNKSQYISGGLIEKNKGFTNLPCMGILDGRNDLLKQKASFVLTYFHIISSNELGIKKLKFGNARPFLDDGGLRYKKKWKMKLKVSNDMFGIFGLKILKFNDSISSLLLNNPFIFLDGGNLEEIVFVNEYHFEEFNNIRKKHQVKGLSDLILFNINVISNESISTLDTNSIIKNGKRLSDNAINKALIKKSKKYNVKNNNNKNK